MEIYCHFLHSECKLIIAFISLFQSNLVHNKAWLIEALERDYERSSKKTFSDLGIVMTKDEAIQWMMNDWPRLQCIYLQVSLKVTVHISISFDYDLM